MIRVVMTPEHLVEELRRQTKWILTLLAENQALRQRVTALERRVWSRSTGSAP